MSPTWILLLLFGAAFAALLTKICFDPSFRKDMLAQEGQASLGLLSVQGATFTVLFIALGHAMYAVSEKIIKDSAQPTSESQKVILKYFNYINDGIAGNEKAFTNAWNLFTESYKDKKSEKYSRYGYKFPEDYGKLYEWMIRGYHSNGQR